MSKRTSLDTVLPSFMAVLRIACAILVLHAGSASPQPPYSIFDGKGKRIIISHQWSWKLGESFDNSFLTRYGFGYLKVSAREYNDMPIDDTLGVKKGSWLAGFPPAGEAPPELMVVLVASNAVEGPTDTANIQLGVRRIRRLVEVLKAKGVKEVFVSSRHQRMGRARYSFSGAVNPEILDTLFLEAYNRQVGREMAINVMGPSMRDGWSHSHYDWEHPTTYGRQLYASCWLKAMLRYQGGQDATIEQIDRDLAAKRTAAVEEKERYVLGIAGPAPTPSSLRIGDPTTLSVRVGNAGLYGKRLRLRLTTFARGCARMYLLQDSLFLDKQDNLIRVVVPDSATIAPYGPDPGRRFAVQGDSAVFQLAEYNSSIYEPTWTVTTTFRILLRDGMPATRVMQIVSGPSRLPRNAFPAMYTDALGRLLRQPYTPSIVVVGPSTVRHAVDAPPGR